MGVIGCVLIRTVYVMFDLVHVFELVFISTNRKFNNYFSNAIQFEFNLRNVFFKTNLNKILEICDTII